VLSEVKHSVIRIKTNRVVQVQVLLLCRFHTCVWADKQRLLRHRSVSNYGIVTPLLFVAVCLSVCLSVWLGRRLEGCRRSWECHIELDLKEICLDSVRWINLTEDMDEWRAIMHTVMNLYVL
jgi:hypothetical protein